MKATCMILAVAMVFSMLTLSFGGVLDEPTAAAVTATGTALVPGVNLIDKVSDVDTSNFMFFSEFDAQSMPGYRFVNTSNNDGRMWTDKSVNASRASIYDTLGGVADVVTVAANTPEFLVTLSALSQTINETNIIVEPSDTVIIVDVSGSMASNTVPGDGRSRIAVVVDALNDAIKLLMDANDNNRVSVVIYGGQAVSGANYARAQPILALGRYDASTPIFTVSGSNVTVRSGVPAIHSSFAVTGGTPTQLGIRRGAQVLLDVPQGLAGGNGTQFDTGVPNPAGSGNIIVTRQPNIILMTDGEPTFGYTDYRLDSLRSIDGTDNTFNLGNGSTADMGLTALTVMTAAYVKETVRAWYYGADASRSVGFYTIGLGVNSDIANAMLDPFGISASGVPNAQLVTQTSGTTTYNMYNILTSFAPGTANVSFPAIAKNASTSNPSRPITTVSNTGGVSTANYATMSFTAMDKQGLDDAFNSITNQIVNQGHYSTVVDGSPQFSGYLTFSDVLGEYMQFGSFVGLWYNNVKFDGAGFAGAVAANRTSFLNSLVAQMEAQSSQNVSPVFDLSVADQLLTSNMQNPNFTNVISYFVDESRVFLSSAYDLSGAPIAASTVRTDGGPLARVDMYIVQNNNAVDSVTGAPSDLMYIIFQVLTVINPGSFATADATQNLSPTLAANDQIVRWYIPAALIPMRSVEPVIYGGQALVDDLGFPLYNIAEANPLRVIYTVTPRLNDIVHGLTAQYMSVNTAPGNNSFYFYTNRWRGTNGLVDRGDLANMTLAFFQVDAGNSFYADNTDLRGTAVIKLAIPVGPTGTSPFVVDYRYFTTNPTFEVQRLGNNGRVTLEIPPYDVTLRKTFNFPADSGLTVADLSEISFTIVGFDSTLVEIYRTTVFFNQLTPDGTGGYTIQLQLPPGTYTVTESGGYALGYLVEPSDTLPIMIPNIAGPPYEFNLTNAYIDGVTPGGGIYLNKVWHGLTPNQIPNFQIELFYDGSDDVAVPSDTPFAILTQYDFATAPQTGIHIQYFDQFDTPSPHTYPLLPGWYRIVETVPSVPGFTFIPPSPTVFTVTAEDLIDGNGFMFTVNNIYTPEPPPPTFNLTMLKRVLGIDGATDVAGNVVIPNDLAFKIELKDSTSPPWDTVSLATITYSDIMSGQNVLVNMPMGTYTITEIGGVVPGFDGPAVSFSATLPPNPDGTPNSYVLNFVGPVNESFSFGFTNVYTPQPPPPPPDNTMRIAKSFVDLPADMDVFDVNNISPITFLVLGNDANNVEIFRQTVEFNRTNFMFNQLTGQYEFVLHNLPPGNYRVYEQGGIAPGFVVDRPNPPQLATIVDGEAGVTVTFVNQYVQAPDVISGFTAHKMFHGLTDSERPPNFQLHITGPNGFDEILDLDQSVNGTTFANITPGTYTIDELNKIVDGFVVNVMVGGQPVTLPYNFDVAQDSVNLTIVIDNFYSPEDPPEPPEEPQTPGRAPQTGVVRNLLVPILLLVFGFIIVGGAEVHRRRQKREK
ncbi:MAG: VWA domain-containing protein [Oscillospiraceae bacterium]|nr:VWA domain-containing protein [Oscillospiraceae bacterium]